MGRPLEEAVLFERPSGRAIVGTRWFPSTTDPRPPLARGRLEREAGGKARENDRGPNLYTEGTDSGRSPDLSPPSSPARRGLLRDLARHVDKEVEVCGGSIGGRIWGGSSSSTSGTARIHPARHRGGRETVEKLNLETVVRITGTRRPGGAESLRQTSRSR
jgi:hypothetical protein